jgi:crotonobetainyl-CoA:carnitine CoA-transferase CaiB-like acyl-CoA transferase
MTDTVAQAFSGMMHLGVDTKGKPQKIGHYIVDLVASLYGFQAISAAMFSRQRGLGGCFLDINLMQAAASLQAAKIAEFAFHKGPSAVINAPAGTYRTADGWIAVTLTKDEQFFRLCSAIDRNDLRNNDRFLTFALRADHIQELQSQLSSIFAVRPSAFWLEKLQEADVMVTSVLDHRQWLDDLHVRATNAAQIVTQPGFGDLPVPAIPGVMPLGQGDRRGVAPDMGGNSAEILYELGYSRAEVQHLIDADVIAIRTG